MTTKKASKPAPQKNTEQETAEQEVETILGVQLPVYDYFFAREVIAFERILIRAGKDDLTFFGRQLEFFDVLMEGRGPRSRPQNTTLTALQKRSWTVAEQSAFNASLARLAKPFTEMLVSRQRADRLQRISQFEPEAIAAAIEQHEAELEQLKVMLKEAQSRTEAGGEQ